MLDDRAPADEAARSKLRGIHALLGEICGEAEDLDLPMLVFLLGTVTLHIEDLLGAAAKEVRSTTRALDSDGCAAPER